MRIGDIVDSFNGKAVSFPGLSKQVDVTTEFVAEAEVFSDQKPLCVQPFDQQVFNEAFRRHVGQALVETLHDHLLHALLVKR